MNPLFEGKTYYDILEISTEASPHEIKKAYEKAKLAYSASSPALYTMFSEQEAQELNQLVETAYNVLSHPHRRNDYDKSININTDSNSEKISKVVEEAELDHSNQKTGTSKKDQSLNQYTIDSSLEEMIQNTEDFDGDFIQKVRHYKNVSLEQLSERSKISKTYILAVESHDYESLPARVFVRGFVVQLAKILGLDGQKVANSYMKNYDH